MIEIPAILIAGQAGLVLATTLIGKAVDCPWWPGCGRSGRLPP